MREIDEIVKYGTTDGHEFCIKESALEWQSNLDYLEYLSYRHNREIDKVTVKIERKEELDILLKYLSLYLKFKGIYNNYDNLEYPIMATYYMNSKKFNIEEIK